MRFSTEDGMQFVTLVDEPSQVVTKMRADENFWHFYSANIKNIDDEAWGFLSERGTHGPVLVLGR